ncbi:hypothetical protein BABINDRAFT_86091 [Babjeviella inositovora NRRL Y-12698]|uniref:Uncharacterized protein n=1 Tax=Babjeviella inositovora NRRL Y-12698 TaxID=984486 RepID=A0A1E3QLH6_9ASCO|nr:uncharacterized protein BABINDRAFT_86091 [Babjeviella inositovora NRRL Y-12698]ODQ78541.1 hypothetical protein BABINDRAFT_86091 [Babjeviella inositovora NRRL Y-12698]
MGFLWIVRGMVKTLRSNGLLGQALEINGAGSKTGSRCLQLKRIKGDETEPGVRVTADMDRF